MKTTSTPPLSHSLPRLLRALPLSVLLAACGGGGDDGGPGPTGPQVPPPGPETSQPITEMPSSSYTGDKLAAFVRLNEARLAAGVSAVEQNAQLDAAAQAHATYQVRNYEIGHGEDPGKPWFTGTDPVSRARTHGYSGTAVSEVISYADPGVAAIESLLLSVYHLHGLLEPRANQVGIGMDLTVTPTHLSTTSITLGTTKKGLLTARSVWHWPTAQQINVNPRFTPASESPNPAPDLATAGTPIMFCGAEGNYAPIRASKVVLREDGMTTETPIRLLVNAAVKVESSVNADVVVDTNLALSSVYQGCLFVLPTTELRPGKGYQVEIHADQAGKDLSTTWNFVTRNPS